jgi:uncharacterized protein (DUF1697 family)
MALTEDTMLSMISLLRGINVGNKQIKMAVLKALYEQQGFARVQTLLQSGNVMFETELTDVDQLATQLEASIKAQFGFESRIVLRTRDQWRDVLQRQPFTAQQLAEPSKVLVTFLLATPTADDITALLNAHIGSETIHVDGREVYAYFPDGMGRSKLDNGLIERKLKTVGTGRNWNTVNKLAALVEAM